MSSDLRPAESAASRLASSLPVPPLGLALLIGLALGWGLNWPAMKVVLQEMGPWSFRVLCLFLGGGALLLITRLSGHPAGAPVRKLPALGLAALFNITGWHLCSAYGLLYIGSGRASIIAFTMPLWASLISVPVLGERIRPRQIVALAAGLAALGLLIGQDLAVLGAAPVGALFMLGAALSWAIGTIMIKKMAPWPMPVTALSGWQLLLGGIPVLIGWWFLEDVPDFTALSAQALVGLTFAIGVAMVFAHTAYFKLVSLVPANVAAISTLAVPVVGVISSAWLLGEAIGLAETTALVLVLAGLVLLLRPLRT